MHLRNAITRSHSGRRGRLFVKHRRVPLGVTVLLIAALAGCGSSSSKSTTASSNASAGTTSASKVPIKFALVSFSIPSEDYLGELASGANAALKQINATGGFGGRPASIVQCNSMLQPSAATDCAHKTIADHPIAMFGCELTWYLSGLPVYAAAHVPSLNCLNSSQDSHNPWSFGIVGGSVAQQGAIANYLCSRPDVKKVVSLVSNVPGVQTAYATAVPGLLKACGKQSSDVIYPVATVDFAPYVAKVLAQKPDFINIATSTGQAAPLWKVLQQDHFPASKTATSDTIFTHQATQEAGSTLAGTYLAAQFTPWGATSDPGVAAYLKATQAAGVDGRDPTVEWGYAYVMALYTAAKQIGFSKFNAETLAQWLRSANGVQLPLSREILNPGPKQYPQVKQPYEQMAQWTGKTFTIVPTGANKAGWVYGY